MKYRIRFVAVAFAILAITACLCSDAFAAAAKKDDAKMPDDPPWTLRDYYSLDLENGHFMYDVNTADWCISFNECGEVIHKASLTATLADGTTVAAPRDAKSDGVREEFKDSLGEGMLLGTEWVSSNGLLMRHRVLSYSNRPFAIMTTTLINQGDAPVQVSAINAAVLEPGGMLPLGPDASITLRKVMRRGPFFVFDPKGPTALMFFNDPTKNATFSLGLIPKGEAVSQLDFEPAGGAYVGKAVCSFDPPRTLNPGESLEADPLYITYGVPESSNADKYFAWAQKLVESANPKCDKMPDCWVSVPQGSSTGALIQAAQSWSGDAVKHALIPAGEDGELEADGARNAGDAIRALKMIPGVTVDPLVAKGGEWVNPVEDDARKHAVARLRNAVGSGYGFVVVRPSAIPDDSLRSFGVTRAQADRMALEIADEAASGAPVFPASACTLGSDLEQWLEAAASTARLKEYGVPTSAVRFDASQVETVDESLKAALTFYGGPIELIGEAKHKVKVDVENCFPRTHINGHPVDAAKVAPKLWLVGRIDQANSDRAQKNTLAVFPGAPQFDVANVPGAAPELRIWRSDGENGDGKRVITLLEMLNTTRDKQ